MPDNRHKRAVVLSGGGARGAYEAGVLQFILDDLPSRKGVDPHFEIVCGTSVGAIHAAFVAATADQEHGRGPRLVKIWEDLHVDEIFHFSPRDVFAIPRKLFGVPLQFLQSLAQPSRLIQRKVKFLIFRFGKRAAQFRKLLTRALQCGKDVFFRLQRRIEFLFLQQFLRGLHLFFQL